MTILIPLKSVGVSREVNGKARTVWPEIGKPFDFTSEEIEHIVADHPKGTALRRPINEIPEVTSNEENDTDPYAGMTPKQKRDAIKREQAAAAAAASSGEDDDAL